MAADVVPMVVEHPVIADDPAPPASAESVSSVDPPFANIRYMCTKDDYDLPIDTSPYAFADHRARTWPFPAPVFSMSSDLS